MSVRGAKNAPVILLGTEPLPTGATLTRWRAPNGHYPQVVIPPGAASPENTEHIKQFVQDNITDRRPHDPRL